MSEICAVLTGMGIGSGGLYIVYLKSFLGYSQKEAQALNLMFFCACILSASVINIYKGKIMTRTLFPLVVSGGITSALSSLFIRGLPGDILTKAFGVFLVIVGVLGLFSRSK